MARIFITGSADGLGRKAAQLLVEGGHDVLLHARNPRRCQEAMGAVPGAKGAVSGDLSSIAETIRVAEQVNALGTCDAVIHNAGIYLESRNGLATHRAGDAPLPSTPVRLPQTFAVNTLAPYVLTCLINRPRRLIYISSGLHRGGDATLKDLAWKERRWNSAQAYADSKLQIVMLAFAVARLWPDVCSNALDPGWVATKMGGPGAPDDLREGSRTQVWLAVSNDPAAMVSGGYFYHMQPRTAHPAARDVSAQNKLLDACRAFTGIAFDPAQRVS